MYQVHGADTEANFREYRTALVERCRAELGAALVPGEVGIIVDPVGDAFAQGICRLLGASETEVTCACIPAASLAAGLRATQPELARALSDTPPYGMGWIVVVGRGGAALALMPHERTARALLN
jgi:hypothetical protein